MPSDDITQGIDAGIDQQLEQPNTGDAAGGPFIMADIIPTADVFEGAYLCPEAVTGTTPAGDPTYYALQSLTLDLQPNTPIDDVTARGVVVPVGATKQKEMTDVSFSADLSFNDMCYLFSGYLCTPYVAADTAHPTVGYWNWKPQSSNADTFQTYTGIEGQEVGASGAPGIVFNSLDFTFEEKKAAVTGKGFARILDDTVSAPEAPTFVPLLPISPSQMNVYVASTYAGLGAGQIADCYGMKLTLPDRQSPVTTRDARTNTYSGQVQKRLAPTASIIVDKNGSSAAYMTQLRAIGEGFCRIEFVGPEIGATGISYTLAFEFAFRFKKNARAAANDVLQSTFDMSLMRDTTFLGGTWLHGQITTDFLPAAGGITPTSGGGALPIAASATLAATNATLA